MTSVLRAAILGTRHPHVFPRIDLLRERDDVELLGFIEDDDEIAERLTARTGLTRLVQGDLGEIDLAVVEGLDPQVVDLTRLALDRGARGILLEKPGAHSPETFFELAEALAAAGTVVEIGYELHYAPAVDWCRELVGQGVLGQITSSRFHGGCPSGAGAELWQSIPEDLGGLVYTEGSHVLEIVHDLFGTPDQVSASVRRLPQQPPHEALVYKPDLFSAPEPGTQLSVGGLVHEDVAAAILEYPGQIVSVDLTAWEPTTWCTQWWIEIYGTNGSAVLVPQPSELRLHLRQPAGRFGAGETVLRAPADPARPGLLPTYARQLDSLVARVRAEPVETACGLGHAVGVMRILQAVYASARERAWKAPVPVGIPDEAMSR